MKLLDAKTASDAVKLTIFMVVTSLATGLLVITIGNVSFGQSTDYKAVFTDVTGLNTGDDVRISGVRVGSVKSIDIYRAQLRHGDVRRRRGLRAQPGDERHDPVPEPGRPALHRAHPGVGI